MQAIGTLDLEALFASSERVKWLEILAAEARYHNLKRKWLTLSILKKTRLAQRVLLIFACRNCMTMTTAWFIRF
ncbi:hypothetical protein FHY68_17130 [Bacillus pacificus]|nr:hypothetical protein FHY68_17130 [Bacillus pacificus]